MKGYLQCQGNFSDRLIIGPAENQLRPSSIAEVEGLPLVGHFAYVENKRVMLYRWDNELRFREGDAPTIILRGDTADWSLVSSQAEFTIKRGEEVIFKRTYSVSSELKTIGGNPTPFIEAEDYDFFLFIRNVLSTPERAQRMYLVP